MSPAWNRFSLCLLFSFLLSLAFPPFQLGFLAFWAFIPLFYLLDELKPKQAVIWGYIAGFFWNAGTLYWIGWVTMPGLIGVLLVLPLYVSIYSWLHVFFRDRLGPRFVFIIPVVWVTIEYLKSLGSLAFPWTSMAYTQTYYTDLIQYASITGAYGVSFWVVLINVILFLMIRQRRTIKKLIFYLIVLILLFVIPFIYSKLTIPKSDDLKEDIKVALIQGNIDPYIKWSESFLERNFVIYDSLSQLTKKSDPDLIIWPETATVHYIRNRPDDIRRMNQLTESLDASILTGAPDYEFLSDGTYNTYNSLLLFQPGVGKIQSYWKVHLVPFGERVPFEDSISFLHDFFESLNMGTGDFSPGRELKIFQMQHKNELLPIIGVICYESVFPDLVRRFVKMGGKLLVIVTNDAWFGNTSGPYQHAQIAIFRAIENRICIARCANTGISSFIDPFGRIMEESKYNKQTTLVKSVPLRDTETFYTKYGDVFSFVLLGFSCIGFFFALLQRR